MRIISSNCVGRRLNEPFRSDRKFKKKQVCVRDKDRVINIHFGDKRYEDFTQHKDPKRRASFRARHGCDPISNLDKRTPRYWACQKLWTFFVGMLLVILLSGVGSAFDWTNGTISYYDFDAGIGNTVIDQFGNYNLTEYNTPNWTTDGKINGGTNFSIGNHNSSWQSQTSQPLLFNSQKITVNAWVNLTNLSGDPHIIQKYSTGSGHARFNILHDTASGKFRFFSYYDAGGYSCYALSNTITNTWYMITFVVNSSNGNNSMYVNGEHQCSFTGTGAFYGSTEYPLTIGTANNFWNSPFHGTIDEVGIWNRSLSESEILELYNSGYGLAYLNDGSSPQVNLIFPTNLLTITDIGANFTTNFNVTGSFDYNWTNATYNIWLGNGTIFNQTTVSLSGNNTQNIQFIDDFTLGSYKWNVYGCYQNSTLSNCTWAINNFTFTVGASINATTYNTSVYETSRQSFTSTLNLVPGTNLYSAQLNYNGTFYDAQITDLGSDSYSFTRSLDIPTTSGTTNKSFFWRLIYSIDNNQFINENTTSLDQTVLPISMFSCASGNVTANFTAYDEQNLTRLTPFSFLGSFSYWLGDGTVKKTLAINNASVSQSVICLNPYELQYKADTDIEYTSAGYVTRNYNLFESVFNNSQRNISLLLLNSADSTSFIIKVQDENLLPVADAFVLIQRYYPGEDIYRTVQIAQTDSNGKTVGFYKTETVDYRHIIMKDGVTLLTTTKQKIVGEEVPYTLTFTIGNALDAPWDRFVNITNLTATLTFTPSTRTVSYLYSDTSNIFEYARLLVTQVHTNGTIITICNTNSTLIASGITCDLSSYNGTFVAYGYYKRTGETEDWAKIISFVITSIPSILDKTGLIAAWFIILTSAFAFIWNPTAGIVSINAAVIFVNLIGLASFSPIFIFGLIGVSITLIVLMET